MLDVCNYVDSELLKIKHYVELCYCEPSLLIVTDTVNNPANQSYIKRKVSTAQKVGIKADVYEYSYNDISDSHKLQKLCEQYSGCIVQYPFYDLSWDKFLSFVERIPKQKDVDGFRGFHIPCTPLGITNYIGYLAKERDIDLSKSKYVVLGKGKLVGNPLVEIFHSHDLDVTNLTRSNSHLIKDTLSTLGENDFVICATNTHSLINESNYNSKPFYIDCGCELVDGKLLGNVSRSLYSESAKITPVPNGVGKLTVLSLLNNTVFAHQC